MSARSFVLTKKKQGNISVEKQITDKGTITCVFLHGHNVAAQSDTGMKLGTKLGRVLE